MVFCPRVFAAAVLFAMLVVPLAHAADTVSVKISFPSEANKTNVDTTFALSKCTSAFYCFREVSTVNCKYYEAKGALACAGHPEVGNTCLITGIDGYSGPGWFGFYVNGQLADTGISCYFPKAGDVLELRYSGNPDSEVSTPTPTPIPTPVPTPTPVITPYPGLVYDVKVSTPTPAASPTATPSPAPSSTPSPTPAATAQAGSPLTGDFVLVVPSALMQGVAVFIVGAVCGACAVYFRKRG